MEQARVTILSSLPPLPLLGVPDSNGHVMDSGGRRDMGDSGSTWGKDGTWGTVVGLGGQAQGMVVGLG